LSSGQIVGPLWTWMFLIPRSAHMSRNGTASGSVSFQPREPLYDPRPHPEQLDPGRSPVDPLTSPLGEVRRLKEDR